MNPALRAVQENPQGGKREVEEESSTGRSNNSKRDEPTEAPGAQSPEQRLTVLGSEPAREGGPHTELDSDSVSDDSDQELDIEDDDEQQFTRRPSL